MAVNIVEIYKVLPSKGAPSQIRIPLYHSDKIWFHSDLSKTLFFYHARFSESLFYNYVVPSLKNSLSLALNHFPTLVGKLTIPLTAGIFVSHFLSGDSVALMIAQSDADFQHLTGDQNFIDFVELEGFVPHLPPPTYLSHQIAELSATAIQVTLFPNFGICIGINIHHALAHSSTVERFVRAWALVNKFKGGRFHSYYKRGDTNELDMKHWKQMMMVRPTSPRTISSHEYVEARFVMNRTIEKILIKFLLREENPAAATRDSSIFVVATAYVWCCLAMSAAAAGETISDDEPEFLALALDFQPRLETHFSNFLTPVLVESTHGALKRKGCFVASAEAIKKAIRGSLEGSRSLSTDLSNLAGNRKLVVGGWPTFDAYGVDYGWGRPQMFTSLASKHVYICKSRNGGVEIVMRRPRAEMEAFAAIFDRGLEEIEDLHIISSL